MRRFQPPPQFYQQRISPYLAPIAISCLLAVLLFFAARLFLFDENAVVINVVPIGETDQLNVQVEGAVDQPGVYEIPVGGTTDDAIEAAGGLAEGAEPTVNSPAAPVDDGQVLVVGEQDGAADVQDVPIDINMASAAELESLPGIGPVIAERIIQHRLVNGPFANVDELTIISGISARMIDEMRSQIIVLAE